MRSRITLCAGLCVWALVATQACASLQQLGRFVQAPRFERADDQPNRVTLVRPTSDMPLGGASIRVWTRVTNPNRFGLTLSTVRATLLIEGTRAAQGDFPLGLPLQPGEESTVPFDLSISYADVPALATALSRSSRSQPLEYQLDGTIGVDAGALGQPTFGPMTLVQGELNPGGAF